MKRLATTAIVALSATLLLAGCVAIGNRVPSSCGATLGQQLTDLEKAKEAGALTEAEFQAQKAKLLQQK
jgi:hypothetical protein